MTGARAAEAFITNQPGNAVAVVDLDRLLSDPAGQKDAVIARIPVPGGPAGIALSADGRHIFVANWFDNSLSAIDTATLKVARTMAEGDGPRAFGVFIRRNAAPAAKGSAGPAPK